LNFLKGQLVFWKRFWNPIHPPSCISAKTVSFKSDGGPSERPHTRLPQEVWSERWRRKKVFRRLFFYGE